MSLRELLCERFGVSAQDLDQFLSQRLGCSAEELDAALRERFAQDRESAAAPTIQVAAPSDVGTVFAGRDSQATRPAGSVRQLRGELGKYLLIERIAQGGMGVVYKARQKDLDRVVALKVLLAAEHAAPEDLARFKLEAQNAARLRHPAIVPIHEIGEEGGLHYFTMDFIDGRPLDAYAREQNLSVLDAVRIGRILAEALHHAHIQDVIHRDVKPANVLVDAEGYPHLTDFGLAKDLGADSGLTHTGTAMGTPAYMPPEQARGDRSAIGPQSDIYALGATLYQLVTGAPPFTGESSADVLRQVLTEEPPAPIKLKPRLPRDVDTIIRKAMEKELSRRYATAAELAQDLRRFAEGEAISARPPTLAYTLGRRLRRHRLAAGLSLVFLLALAAVAGTLGRQLGSEGLAARERERRLEAEHQARLASDQEEAERLAGEVRAQAERRRQAERQLEDAAAAILRGHDRAFIERALERIEAAIEIDPRFARAYFLLGRAQDRLGHAEQAIAAYREVVARDSGHDQARFHLGRILVWQGGQAEEAAAVFEAIDRSGPGAALRELGLLYIDLAADRIGYPKVLKRLDELAQALDLEPEYHFTRGRALARLMTHRHFARDQRPRCSTIFDYAQDGFGGLDFKHQDAALAAFGRALALDPLHYPAAYSAGWLQLAARNFQEAQRSFAAALAFNDKFVPAYLLLGRLHFYNDRLDEARGAYDRAAALGHPLPPEYGLLLFAAEQYEAADGFLTGYRSPHPPEDQGPLEQNISLIRFINLAAMGRLDDLTVSFAQHMQSSPAVVQQRFAQMVPLAQLANRELLFSLIACHRILEAPHKDKQRLLEFQRLTGDSPLMRDIMTPVAGSEIEYIYVGHFIQRPARAIIDQGPLDRALEDASRRMGLGMKLDLFFLFLLYRSQVAEQNLLLERSTLYEAEDYYLRACAHYAKDRIAEARADLDRALALDKLDWRYHYGLARCQARLDQAAPAMQSLERARQLGFSHRGWVKMDPDFEALRELASYKAFMRGS